MKAWCCSSLEQLPGGVVCFLDGIRGTKSNSRAHGNAGSDDDENQHA